MSSNIILGGAQLGLNYGVTRIGMYFGKSNSKEIMLRAKHHGITAVDIAFDYGELFNFIDTINPGLDVISKVKLFENHNIEEVLERQFNLKNLKFILVHDADFFTGEQFHVERVEKFITFCRLHSVSWGVSIYEFETLEKFININFTPHLVQYPFNILSEEDPIGDLCFELDIETHVRSVFLQGLLTASNITLLPKQFQNNSVLKCWYRWLEKYNLNPTDACLRNDRLVHRTKVVGVENCRQLDDVVARSCGDIISCSDLIFNSDANLLDPRKWALS